jgi:hypothetical protein
LTACFRLKKPLPGNLTNKFSFQFFHGTRNFFQETSSKKFPSISFMDDIFAGICFPNKCLIYKMLNSVMNFLTMFLLMLVQTPLFPIITYAFHYALKHNLSVTDDIKMDLRHKELDSVYWIYVLRLGPLVGPCENTMDFVVFLKCKGYLEELKNNKLLKRGSAALG